MIPPMRRFAPTVALLLVAAATSRCALVSGLDGLDVASDAGATADASDDSKDAPTGCVCAPIPPGWTSIRFASGTNVACPTGETSVDLLLDPLQATASGACTCTCTPVVDCSSPNFDIYVSPICGNYDGPLKPVTNGTCQPMTLGLVGDDGARAVPINATCTASPAPFSAASTGAGRRCTPPPSSCGAGSACATAPAPFAACIAQDGDVACPTGWEKKTAAAKSVTDGRTCTGCGCSVPNGPACSYDVKSYKNNACTTLVSTTTVAMGNTCTPWTTDSFYTATAKVTATCTPKSGTAAGATTVTGLETICCK